MPRPTVQFDSRSRWQSVAAAAVWASWLGVAAGCVEERVVHYNPMLSGLPNAVSASPRVLRRPERGPAIEVAKGSTREVADDGTITLRSPNVRELMVHIVTTLDQDEKDLFTQQVLSTKTRREFVERGLDPAEAFTALKSRRADIQRLFNAIPGGEFTPGFYFKPLGGQEFRLEVTDRSAEDMLYVGIDVVYERRNFKLRWFVINPRVPAALARREAKERAADQAGPRTSPGETRADAPR